MTLLGDGLGLESLCIQYPAYTWDIEVTKESPQHVAIPTRSSTDQSSTADYFRYHRTPALFLLIFRCSWSILDSQHLALSLLGSEHYSARYSPV